MRTVIGAVPTVRDAPPGFLGEKESHVHRSTWTGLEYRDASDEPVSVVPDLAEKMEAAARDQLPAAVASSQPDDKVAAPLQRLIEGNEAALAAIADRGRPSLPARRSINPRLIKAEQITMTVGPGTDLRFPPYDWSWNWGSPLPPEAVADPTAGTYGTVRAASTVEDLWPAESKGASGLAITLRSPGTGAIVQVRPYVTYEYSWLMEGHEGAADCAGALDLSAWRGNEIVTPVAYAWLWNANVGFMQQGHGGDGGTAWPPDYRVNVYMDADVEYVVNMGAFVSSHASGTNAWAWGLINANLRWVTVERIWP